MISVVCFERVRGLSRNALSRDTFVVHVTQSPVGVRVLRDNPRIGRERVHDLINVHILFSGIHSFLLVPVERIDYIRNI